MDYILGLLAFVTSTVAAVIGFGGGLLLIGFLPAFIGPHLIIPIYGVVQLASNSSRMLFSFKHVQWQFLPRFLIGSIIGACIVGYGLSHMSMTHVPIAIGLYLLLNLWSKRFATLVSRFESFYFIGFLQTGLGLIVGATGPLALSVLTKNLKSKDEIIATSSLFMTISHLAKIPVYIAVSVSVFSQLTLIIYMVVGAILGSFLGTKLRMKVNNDKIIGLIKILLTLLAIKMIAEVLM